MQEPVTARKPVYYPALDGLRLVLAAIVASVHSGLLPWPESAGIAVQIFFALSGWLIGGILICTTPEQLPRFYFNRVTRIWLPYAVALALLVFVSLIKEPVTAKWLEFVAYKFTFTYNLFAESQFPGQKDLMPLDGTGHHFWSIGAEEQFYLLAPLLMLFVPGRLGKTPWFWLIVFSVATMVHWQFFAAISLGVVAACLNHRFGNWHREKRAIAVMLPLAAGLFWMIYSGTASSWLAQPLFSVLTVLLLAIPGPPNAIMKIAGGISYPMYLNHWIGVFAINLVARRVGIESVMVLGILKVLASFVASAALYFAVDRVVMANRDRFYTPARGRAFAVMAYCLTGIGLVFGTVVLLLRGSGHLT